MIERKYLLCVSCGRSWNVPNNYDIGNGKYICPDCATKERNRLKNLKEGKKHG